MASCQYRTIMSVSESKNPGKIRFENQEDHALFADNDLASFEALWDLPHIFVDDVNYRRGGWSAVSTLELGAGEQRHIYFVKRQENQFRYSLRRPFGRLTFADEVDAIRLVQSLGLPAVDMVCFGISRQPGVTRGILVTRRITLPTLADLIESKPNWNAILPELEQIGNQLYRIHANKIRHGAFYPNHIFADIASGKVQMIDFEGARLCRTSAKAIKADLPQLLRRLTYMPEQAINALLRSYLDEHYELVQSLMSYRKKP